jgi:hypothetical protein
VLERIDEDEGVSDKSQGEGEEAADSVLDETEKQQV